jgi:hypothetical protein
VTSKRGGGLPSKISEGGMVRSAGLMFPDEYGEFAAKVWEGEVEWGHIYTIKPKSKLLPHIKTLFYTPVLDSYIYDLKHLKLMILNLNRICKQSEEPLIISTAWPFRCGYVDFTVKDFIIEIMRYDWGRWKIMFHDKNAITRAQVYADLGVPVIPCIRETKNPKVSGWTRSIKPREFSEYIDDDDSIAVKLGKDSGLIAVDFDYDVRGIKDKILAAIPPSDIIKIGSKGLTVFYKTSGEEIKSRFLWFKGTKGDIPIVEVLSEGRKTMVPPSVHPMTRVPYRWESRTLVEGLTEGMETLSAKGVEDIVKIAIENGCFERGLEGSLSYDYE